MKKAVLKQSADNNVLVPNTSRFLEHAAIQWVAKHQWLLVMLAWLGTRVLQLFFLQPNSPQLKYYFDIGSKILHGDAPYSQFQFEYAPGAALLMALPRLFADSIDMYAHVFAVQMLLFDACILYIIWNFASYLWGSKYANHTTACYDTTVAMLFYVFSTGFLGLSLLFEHIDLAAVCLCLLWLSFTVANIKHVYSDAVLALGIVMQPFMLLLLPLSFIYDRYNHRHLSYAIKHLSYKLGFVLLLLMPYVIAAKSNVWQCVEFYFARGVQIESFAASVLLLWQKVYHFTIQFRQSFAGVEIYTDNIRTVVNILMVCLLFAVCCVCAWFKVVMQHEQNATNRKINLLYATLAVVIAVLLCHKSFLPVYLIYTAPLMGLCALTHQEKTRYWLFGLGVVFFLTHFILMFFYNNLVNFDIYPIALLLGRNALLATILMSILYVYKDKISLEQYVQQADRVLHHPIWLYVASALLIIWVFTANLSETTANDIWIQIRAGADIVKTGKFPDTEIYSSTVYGRPFIAHEWLSSVLFHILVSWFDGAGLSFLASVVALACYFFLYYAVEKNKRHHWYFLALLIFTCHLISFRMLVRPHVFTLVAYSVIVFSLEHWRRDGKTRQLLYLVPMQLIWVNMHGGALFGPALMGLLTGVVVLMVIFPALQCGSESRRFYFKDIMQLAITTCSMALTCLINPYGYKLLIFSLDLLDNEYAKTRVWEWTSPFQQANISYYWLWLFIAALILLWTSVLVRIKTLPLIDFTIAAILTYFSVRANRFVSDLAIFAFPIVARLFYQISSFSLNVARQQRHAWLEIALATLLLSNVALYGYAHSAREHRPMLGWGFGGDMPYQEVDFLKKIHAKGIIYNEYSDGALIIHSLTPDIRPVLDSRIDLYPLDLVDAYDKAYVSPDLFKKYTDKNKVNWVMLYKYRAPPYMLKYLSSDPTWQLLLNINGRVLYTRRGYAANLKI